MLLVGTSVLIAFLNGVPAIPANLLENLIGEEEDVCISDYTLTETLQGFKEGKDFELGQKFLLKFSVYSLKN
jgi:predicted nucleic acid-binding protein